MANGWQIHLLCGLKTAKTLILCGLEGTPSPHACSVDQILHGEAMEGKSTERMQFETLLDELTDAEIKILTATAQALLDARADSEGEN